MEDEARPLNFFIFYRELSKIVFISEPLGVYVDLRRHFSIFNFFFYYVTTWNIRIITDTEEEELHHFVGALRLIIHVSFHAFPIFSTRSSLIHNQISYTIEIIS